MAAPPPVLTVAVEKGPREGETRRCRAGAALRIGRVVKGNDLAVRDTGASQQHLAIEFLPPPASRWAVSHVGSSNRTLLNGAALAPSVPAPLSHGDLIMVGDSTVLAVSIAPDSDPEPCPGRRSSRHAAAVGPVVVEEEMPVVTRRGTRKNAAAAAAAAAEASDAEKGELDAAAAVVEEKPRVVPVVEEEEMPPVVTRRGTRKKAAAAASDAEKGELEAPAVVAEEKPRVVTRRGGRKKTAAQELPEEIEESAVVTRRGVQKKAAEPLEPEKDEEEKEEAMVVTRRGRQKKAVDPPVPEKEEEEEALVVTRRRGRKKDAATIAPPPMPLKTRSATGRARVTRAVARNTVLEEEDEEEQGGNELDAPTGNPSTSTAGNVAARDGEAQGTAKALEEEVPRGKARAPRAAFDSGASAAAAELHGEMEEAAEAMHRGGRKKAIKPPELEKEDDAAVATCRVGRKKATVVTRRGGRRKDVAIIAPPPLPAKTRSGRGRGRVTRASAMTALEEDTGEEQGENEVAATTERTGNLPSSPAVNGGEEKGDNVASGNGEAQGTTKALDEEVPKGRISAQRAASDNWAVVEPHEEMVEAEAAIMTRRGGRKKAAVVTRRGGRKKDAATIAPMPPPAKTRSGRGRGRVTRASARNTVCEEDDEEEQEENEVAAPREQTRNQPATAVNVGQEQKGDSVVAGDGEAQGVVKALEEELPKGRASAQYAGSGNGGEEEQGGARCSSRAGSGSNGIPNTTSKYREDRKLKAHSTPFDVRLDRALKKYSA